MDGTFFVQGSGSNAVLYIYASRFSTYAIAYTDQPTWCVMYESNGGSEVPSATVSANSAVKRPDDPERKSADGAVYRFDAWYSDSKLTTRYDFEAPVTGDLTLYAGWTALTAVTVTAEDYTGTYDGQPHGIAVDAGGYDIEITYDGEPSRVGAGTATVQWFAQSDTCAPNPVSGTATIEITKAALTVTANDAAITWGEAPADGGATFEGFVNGETEAVLGGALAYDIDYTKGSPAGKYAITPKGLTSDNYDITFVAGTLTVKKAEQSAPAGLKAMDASSTTAQDGSIEGVAGGMEYSADGGATWTPVTGTAITHLGRGEYLVRMAGDDNHEPSQAVTVAVGAKEIDPNQILLATLTSAGTNALNFTWTTIEGADGYDVFLIKCTSNQTHALVGTVSGDDNSFTVEGLDQGVAYRGFVQAWIMVDGVKTAAMESPEVHAYTDNGTKRETNPGSLTITKPEITIKLGKTGTVKAKIAGVKKGKKIIKHTNKLRYISGDPSVVTVTNTGVIKAVGPGECLVYVLTVNGIWDTVKVSVDMSPTMIRFKKGVTIIWAGDTLNLGSRLEITPVGADTTLTWTSTKPSVATVDSNGVVTAHKKGTTTIVVTIANRKKATLKITVKASGIVQSKEAPTR